jgi:MFS family permease
MGLALTLVGTFAAIYHPIGNAMLSAIDPARVGRIMGRNGLWGNMGVACAALTTGVLTDLISWRAAFMVPGAVAVAAGIAFFLLVPDPGPLRTSARERHIAAIPRGETVRVFAVLAVATFFAGLIFSATTSAMPKLFEERLTAWTSTISGVGLFVFVVYTIASLAQITIGSLADRMPLGRLFLPLAALQVPLMLATGLIGGVGTLLAAIPMMYFVFGIVPINEVMTARYTLPEHRTRIYAVRYSLAFAGTATAIPLVSWMHKAYGGFAELFMVLAGMSAAIALAALAFSIIERNAVHAGQPASA